MVYYLYFKSFFVVFLGVSCICDQVRAWSGGRRETRDSSFMRPSPQLEHHVTGFRGREWKESLYIGLNKLHILNQLPLKRPENLNLEVTNLHWLGPCTRKLSGPLGALNSNDPGLNVLTRFAASVQYPPSIALHFALILSFSLLACLCVLWLWEWGSLQCNLQQRNKQKTKGEICSQVQGLGTTQRWAWLELCRSFPK
jgi:hypothetical protein